MISTNRVCTYDRKDKIWRGRQVSPRFGPECSIGGEALKALMNDPEHISQICFTSGKEFTNREIATLSIRVAQHFRDRLKIPQCEVIGLCASNSDFVAPLYFGAMLAGLTVSTLDPSFDKDGIKHIFSLTRPNVMFCDGSIYERVKEAMQEIGLDISIYTMNNHIVGVPEISEFLQPSGTECTYKPEPLKECWNQTAIIACSSGTTGLPKGVNLSHAALLNLNVGGIEVNSILCFSSLYWLSGIIALLNGTINNITRIISEKSFSTPDFFDMVEKYRVEGLLTPPSQLALTVADPQINRRDLSSVKFYICGGSAVSQVLIEKLKQYIPDVKVLVGYGMTETNGICSSGITQAENCVGTISDNIEMKIIDDDGQHLGPNVRGEICIKSVYPWKGYCNNVEATANTYMQGWIHSGDIGYFDDENNLFIVDRKKEILKYNNFHFSPTEIEFVIYDIKGVAEVCVCGIPDVVSSFLPAAAVVRVPGSQLTEKDILDHVARTTAHFKHLHGGVYFVEELPKTVSGKVMRRKVTEMCIQMRSKVQY